MRDSQFTDLNANAEYTNQMNNCVAFESDEQRECVMVTAVAIETKTSWVEKPTEMKYIIQFNAQRRNYVCA